MTNPLLALPASVLARLKDALAMGFVRAPYEEAAIRGSVGSDVVAGVLEGLRSLASQGIQDRGVVAYLDAIQAARADVQRPSLVWTGPEVEGLHARDTREVFAELIGRAQSSLWISTYAYFDGKKAFETLAARMDATPALEVHLVLNVHFDEARPDPTEALARAADRLWKHNWPGTRRPHVYYFPESLDPDREQRAVLHAKAIVRDQRELLITSANFTEAALSRNIELGLLVEDSSLALTTVRHYERLIEGERLVRVHTS